MLDYITIYGQLAAIVRQIDAESADNDASIPSFARDELYTHLCAAKVAAYEALYAEQNAP